MAVFLKVLGYIVVVVGLGITVFNGSPTHWEKGTWPKHILIDIAGVAVACGGLALISGQW